MTTTQATRNGTDGRVYGGDPGLVHIKDGTRRELGRQAAAAVDHLMRRQAIADGTRTPSQAWTQPLCPGCFMVAVFNAAVNLARANGQPLAELGRSMAGAFTALADAAEANRDHGAEALTLEEILVRLDHDGETVR